MYALLLLFDRQTMRMRVAAVVEYLGSPNTYARSRSLIPCENTHVIFKMGAQVLLR